MSRGPTLFDDPIFNERLFFPRPDSSPSPKGCLDIQVPVDGASLHLRVHDAPNAKAILLLFHGNGEIVSDYDDAAQDFAAMSAQLAVVDFRGYGRSTGVPTLRAVLDDVQPIVAALNQALPDDRPRIIMGRSLGSQCAAEIAGLSLGRSIAGFIFESAVSDLTGMIRRRQLKVPKELSKEALERFEPLHKIGQIQEPTLVMHGLEDTLVLPREAEAIVAALPKALCTAAWLKGVGHNDLQHSPDYWRAMSAFINKVTQS
jgi:hypothetical protein